MNNLSSSPSFCFALSLSLSNPRLTLYLSLKSTVFLAFSHQIEPFKTLFIVFRTNLTNQNPFFFQFLKNPKFQTLKLAPLISPYLNQNFFLFSITFQLVITLSSLKLHFFYKLKFSPNSSMTERPQRHARTKHTAPRRSSPSRPSS